MGWKLGSIPPSSGRAMQPQPLGQRNAFKSCLLPINNGILLKQPKHVGKSEERSPTGQKFQFIWGQKHYYDVVNILFGPHQ